MVDLNEDEATLANLLAAEGNVNGEAKGGGKNTGPGIYVRMAVNAMGRGRGKGGCNAKAKARRNGRGKGRDKGLGEGKGKGDGKGKPDRNAKVKVSLAGESKGVDEAKEVINSIVMFGHSETTHPGWSHAELDVEDLSYPPLETAKILLRI